MTIYRPVSRSTFSGLLWVTLALLAASCSSSTPAEPVVAAAATAVPEQASPITPPGVLYVTTSNGELQAITPATGSTQTIWSPADGEAFAFEVAPVDRSAGLHVVLSSPDSQIDTSLHEIAGEGLRPVVVEGFTSLTICLDPHSNSEVSVGHQLLLSNGQNGSSFAAFPFDTSGALDPSAIVELSRVSMACPRYTAARDIVATSAPAIADEPDTIAAYIDGERGAHQVTIDGCNLTPTSFSPDDEWMLFSAVCYGGQWADSGLYALPLVNLGSNLTLADMPRLGSGVFGRSAWHPDANWVVSTRIDAVPNQAPTTDLRDQRAALVLIDIRTGQVIEQSTVGGGQPNSLAWATQALHSDG